MFDRSFAEWQAKHPEKKPYEFGLGDVSTIACKAFQGRRHITFGEDAVCDCTVGVTVVLDGFRKPE
jgi:hypothetical protein